MGARLYGTDKSLTMIKFLNTDKTSRRDLMVLGNSHNLNDAIKIGTNESGSWKYYGMFGEHNSNAVVIGDTAPAKTDVLWIDTVNKKAKAYISGAWTVIG